MHPLIPLDTLSVYLSKSGFPKFRQWFKSKDILEPIHSELENLTYLIETSTWLEDKLRKESLNKIKSIIIKHIENLLGESPELYFQKWIDSIQQYCFQGGFGHRILYSGDIPHHWCVYCEYYEKVKNIPINIILCGVVCDKYISLSDTPDRMYWN